MNVLPLPMILPQALPGESEKKAAGGGGGFGEVLINALKDVNDAQLKADEVTKKFLVGDIQDIHQVTIASEQAKLMLQLAVEVRNKVVEAYQEVSRMQV
ncbi:MAG: flagellar hook-basal body complex protein FliE [Bacillota bacterium]